MIAGGVMFGVLGKIEVQVQGQPIGKGTGLLLSDIMLIVAIAVALFLILLIWAKYLRNAKGRKRRTGGQKVYRESDENPEEAEIEEAPADSRRRYKYRYRRRSHRSRNPTLAETGGLPPTRREDTAKSPQ